MAKILKISIAFLIMSLGISTMAQTENVIYKYKKNEKFDFEALNLDGDYGNPGDLSIVPRYQKKYRNKLPYRKNFNSEIRSAVDKIR